jgi:DNA-binding response OmpR family regulator
MRQPDKFASAILVVDDDDCIVTVVKAFLESAGYAVFTAGDGDAGLALFRQHRPAISMVLTDVDMPRMNGLDLADRILQLDCDLPVLFMSGASFAANRGYGCVAKPFRGSELLARVGSALGAVTPETALSAVCGQY